MQGTDSPPSQDPDDWFAESDWAGGPAAAQPDDFDRFERRGRLSELTLTLRTLLVAALVVVAVIVVIGLAISGVFSENESYDAITATWRSELPMATPRHGIGAAAISGRIFIPAGATVAGFGTSDINDAFVPDTLPRRRAVRR